MVAHTLGKQREVDPWEFKASLVYRVSSSTATATERNSVRKKERKEGLVR